MLDPQLSSNVNRIVRPPRMQIGGIAPLDLSNDRDSKRVRATPPAMSNDPTPLAVAPFVEMDRPATTWWSTALEFFMEGFAVYGAALHPSAAFSVEEASVSANAHQARFAGSRDPAVAHEQRASQYLNGSNVIAPELGAWIEQHDRGDWLAGLGEKIVALWTHWRREQEIRRAVRALAEYDDRTLRDIGIQGRADIERMVRYCRDC
ncbi:DUF1127 domain-containing protein [Bradyrhizobium sp. CB2312]|uniref:DUF1127 domain-containing protein n=1 Tax=Bradyrhizobium sp. CB2312 TaxID=3039155 RepID=UPI0024B1F1C4|nr:DUF1127 domain-containing protein [Bradyrhizobium sp. CB2312]WFU69934.1 DUF1127 domain-containing protein [Bradyrhizobium sp. CB2312]